MTKKKGLHYRTKLYKLLLLKYYAISALAYCSVSVVSLVSVILCALYDQAINAVIYGVTLAVSFTGAIIKCVEMGRSYTQRFILEQKEYRDKIIKSATEKMSISHDKSHYKWENYAGQHFLYSPQVDDKLFEGCKNLRITVSPQKPAMDADQKEALYNIVCKKIAQGRSIFNSDMVRLRTDMLLDLFKDEPVIKSKDGAEVEFASDSQIKDDKENRKNLYKAYDKNLIRLEKTDYFYNISTNDQIYSKIFKFDYSSSYSGRDKSLDESDTLYDLSQSPSANIIGVTTFAITSDGYILLNLQGEMNDVNRGCFVPSGSGSADFKDLIECKPYEPKGLRGQVENLANGNLHFAKLDDKRFPQVNSPKKFKTLKGAYLKELKNFVKTHRSSENEETVEREYKNATVAKAEREQFRDYSSKMKQYTYDFNTFLKYGMVRELIEESHLYETAKRVVNGKEVIDYREVSDGMRRRLIDDTYVCGYIRILDRGGKPDFFGFTMLNETLQQVRDMFKYGRNSVLAEEVKGNYKVTDFNEVSDLKYAPFAKLCEYEDDVKQFVQVECGLKGEIKISLQTYCLLKLLCKDGPKQKIMDFLQSKSK